MGWLVWFVYIVECSDGTYYTGITTDIERRVAQHSAGMGAKYTRSRSPVRLVAKRCVSSRSFALRLEYHVKKQAREKKIASLESWQP